MTSIHLITWLFGHYVCMYVWIFILYKIVLLIYCWYWLIKANSLSCGQSKFQQRLDTTALHNGLTWTTSEIMFNLFQSQDPSPDDRCPFVKQLYPLSTHLGKKVEGISIGWKFGTRTARSNKNISFCSEMAIWINLALPPISRQTHMLFHMGVSYDGEPQNHPK